MSEVCGDCGSWHERECRRMPPTALDRQHEAVVTDPSSGISCCLGGKESYVTATYPVIDAYFPACDEFHPREDEP